MRSFSSGLDTDIHQEIVQLLHDSPENLLPDFPGQHIFNPSAIGVADGDDPIFQEFRQVVGSDHLLPRELLERHAPGADLACVRVVAWALPFSEGVRRANRNVDFPSRLYSLARNNGAVLIERMSLLLATLLETRGVAEVVPAALDAYTAYRCPTHQFSSTWSERHVAFAAGLGRFGLSNALLTPVGSNVRLGSIVVNLPLSVTVRAEGDHRAPCLAAGGKTCGRCMTRCPAGAISAAGMDKAKCYLMRERIREKCLKSYASEMHMISATIATSGHRKSGYSLGCALCQCGVPCEQSWPGG